jgi:hypothetical protein
VSIYIIDEDDSLGSNYEQSGISSFLVSGIEAETCEVSLDPGT